MEPSLKELRTTNPQIETIHFISDGPLTQYRNKGNFYLLSTVPFLFGFVHITWNYSEKYHGKCAPDGVGAAVKREADQYVLRGGELQTPHREVSCFSKHAEMKTCSCYQPVKVDLRTTSHTEEVSTSGVGIVRGDSDQDICGKFVIVTYDELRPGS